MLPGIWQHVAQIDPILYLMQGFRYGFLGIYGQHIYMTTFIAIMLVLVLFGFCLYLMRSGKGLRA